MKLYVGAMVGKALSLVRELGCGVMISSCPSWPPSAKWRQMRGLSCALDNGAYGAWSRGLPFNRDVFLRALAGAHRWGLSLDFIVAPDIICGGRDSMTYSTEWAYGELRTAPRLALAVQDGLTTSDITSYELGRFTHLFVGGSREWKYASAPGWVEFAHSRGKQLHIAGIGTLDQILWAESIGADSVDSTTMVRNGRWDDLRQVMTGRTLFSQAVQSADPPAGGDRE